MEAAVMNNRGFSLVELLVSIIILLVSLLGLLPLMIQSINANLNDDLRNTAVRLTSQTAEAIHSLPFDDADIMGSSTGVLHTRAADGPDQDRKGFPKPSQTIRNFQQNYVISWNVVDRNDNIKEIVISVAYSDQQREAQSHSAVIYKHRKP